MRSSPIFPLLLVILLVLPAAARTGAEPYKVGVLFWHESPNDDAAFEGVTEGFRLAKMDWTLERVNADRDAALAEKTLRGWEERGLDLVIAMGTSAALSAKRATSRVPVLFTAVTNPVASGVIASDDGSGTNLCGNTNWIETADVMEVFKDAVPGLARLGVVYNQKNPVSVAQVSEAHRTFKEKPDRWFKLFPQWIEGPKDLQEAVRRVVERGVQALWVPIDEDVYKNLAIVHGITRPKGIPLLSSQASVVRKAQAEAGVAVDYRVLGQRAVILARKVLVDGADPGSLPLGKMQSFRVLVNLEPARKTGFRLPFRLLATADRIWDGPVED
jgi:putative ABC transport system substrate-binding protein